MRSDDVEWTVLTWNIQGSKRTDIDRVGAVIAAETPDVVALQEVRRPQADRLAHSLDMAVRWNEKHHPWRPFFPNQAEGAAILTPHDLIDPDHARVSDARSMRTYRRRIAQWAVVQRPDHSAYRVFNVHLSPHDLHAERRTEADRIAKIAEALGTSPPRVVAGDFNDEGTAEIIDILPGIEDLPPPPTNPSELPSVGIDHVLLPPDATSVSASVPAGGAEWAELSDHLPLTVRFSLEWVRGGIAS